MWIFNSLKTFSAKSVDLEILLKTIVQASAMRHSGSLILFTHISTKFGILTEKRNRIVIIGGKMFVTGQHTVFRRTSPPSSFADKLTRHNSDSFETVESLSAVSVPRAAIVSVLWKSSS